MKHLAKPPVILVLLLGLVALAWFLFPDLSLFAPRPQARDEAGRLDIAAARSNPVFRENEGREEFTGETHRTSGALQALVYWASQRAYPREAFPSRGYSEAFDLVKTRFREPQAKGRALGPWRPIGPRNIAGRMLALAFNPQNPHTIYAGAASGGLWRSFTAGVGADAWEYVPTGHPVLGVGAIAFAPSDSNVLYIGTGEVYGYQSSTGGITERLARGSYGIGILKSEDGGRTWSKSLDWSYHQERGVQVIRVDPTRPEVVWAGTTEGIYRSGDAGLSWQQVHTVVMTTDIVINPAHPDTVYAACGNLNSPDHGLYRTRNGGQSWTKMEQLYIVPSIYRGKALLSICESQPDVVMASIGNGGLGGNATWLVRSEDGGDTWTRPSSQDYSLWQGWFSHDVAIHPDDPSIVITVGVDIWKSTTAGANLQKKSDWEAAYFGLVLPGEPEGPPGFSHADHHDLVFHPVDHDVIYFANDGGVFRSLDGGETFAGCNGGLQTAQFYPGFSSSWHDSSLAIGGMQDNSTGLYVGLEAWYRLIGGDGGWAAIDPVTDSTLYGTAQYLMLFKSTNTGASWFEITPPEQGTTGFIAPYAVAGLQAPATIYAGRSRIYKSTNGGVNWYVTNANWDLDGNPALSLDVALTDPQRVYVTTAPTVTRAGVFRTTDGATSWQNVTGSLPDRYLVGMCIHPFDPDIVFLTASGFGTSHVFRSLDGGDTWDDIGTGLPDVPTSSVVVDPLATSHVYVGNDLGVFVSRDAGDTWEEYSLGLPDAVMVTDLTISLTSHELRATTHGNGVYERPLLSTLTAVPEAVPAAPPIVLAPNHPNPFNPLTTIAYRLSREGMVRLAVFDLAGHRVRTLVQAPQSPGSYDVEWDGRNDRGRALPSGTYLYRLEQDGLSRTRKMLLLR